MTISQSEMDALLSSAGELIDTDTADDGDSGPDDTLTTHVVTKTTTVQRPRPKLVDYPPELARIMRMRVPVLVTLAQRYTSLGSVVSWTQGSIIEFDIPADSELSLIIGNKKIGQGHAVKVGENFGLRVTLIGDIVDRIVAMGS